METANQQSFLNVESACRHFGGNRAVENVSFTLQEGCLAALIGPNGAGKTTMFNMISGAMPVSSGKILFRGKPVQDSVGACKMGIARTFQNIRLFHDLTVLENIMAGMGGISFWQGSLRLPRSMQEERSRIKRAYHLMEDTGIESLAQCQADSVPFGQQRLIEIARALATRPKFLLLDEPAAGLNRTETTVLGKLIRHLHSNGITILLVEHDMHLVMNLVQRVLVLNQGKLIADGSPEAIQKNAQVRTAYLGGE